MKTKPTLLSLFLLLTMSICMAQNNNQPISIISGKVNISKYHDSENLRELTKGKLLTLYKERIEVIVKILPNIAFATKPGITMSDIGIPNTKENRKALEANIGASNAYFDSTIEFQNKILPYSDKNDLIAAILFYEETLKSLHTYKEFN